MARPSDRTQTPGMVRAPHSRDAALEEPLLLVWAVLTRDVLTRDVRG